MQSGYFNIKLHVYPNSIHLFSNCSNDEVRNKLNELGICRDEIDLVLDRPPNDSGLSYLFSNGSLFFRLLLDSESTIARDTVIHESFHIMFRVMKYIEQPVCEENEESCAYLLEYICKNVFEKIEI